MQELLLDVLSRGDQQSVGLLLEVVGTLSNQIKVCNSSFIDKLFNEISSSQNATLVEQALNLTNKIDCLSNMKRLFKKELHIACEQNQNFPVAQEVESLFKETIPILKRERTLGLDEEVENNEDIEVSHPAKFLKDSLGNRIGQPLN